MTVIRKITEDGFRDLSCIHGIQLSSSHIGAKPPYLLTFGYLPSRRPRILNSKHQYILRPDLLQPIHHARHFFLHHHTAHRRPLLILERRDGRRPLPRRDLGRFLEQSSGDVVLA